MEFQSVRDFALVLNSEFPAIKFFDFLHSQPVLLFQKASVIFNRFTVVRKSEYVVDYHSNHRFGSLKVWPQMNLMSHCGNFICAKIIFCLIKVTLILNFLREKKNTYIDGLYNERTIGVVVLIYILKFNINCQLRVEIR